MTRISLSALTLSVALTLPGFAAAEMIGDMGISPDLGLELGPSISEAAVSALSSEPEGDGLSESLGEMLGEDGVGGRDIPGGTLELSPELLERLGIDADAPATPPEATGAIARADGGDGTMTRREARRQADIGLAAQACGAMGGAQLMVRNRTFQCRSGSGQTIATFR